MVLQRKLSLLVATLSTALLSEAFNVQTATAKVFLARCPEKAAFVFREGDTLSEVLWYLGSEPVYGKRGWIERTFKLNPGLEEYRNKIIPPGTRVTIPIKSCPLIGGWSIENGELVAPYHHKARATVKEPESKESSSQVLIKQPTQTPTPVPTLQPTQAPAPVPTLQPTQAPAPVPTLQPTQSPAPVPTLQPTQSPAPVPTLQPTQTLAPVPIMTPSKSAENTNAVPIIPPISTPTPLPTRANTKRQLTQPRNEPAPATVKKAPASQRDQTPSGTRPVPTATLGPIQKLRLDIKKSKETFEKIKNDEGNFLRNLKKDDDFKLE